ncbi:IS3 family transposase [Mycolicibacterium sp. NCC-Tsukiji]|uniref:IS3 family transposase n=1 Tax=Mycolicibacterium sp. NCC-Tsukiji TaxID=2185272 RepID=UPI0035B55DB6
MHAVLIKQGWKVAKKTVLALMRALGLHCPVRRRRRYSSFQGEVGTIAENVLVTRPGVSGGSRSWEDLSYGTSEQVPRRVA